MCYLKVLFFVILMVKVSQHPGKGGHHLDIQYQYPPVGSSQPHGKQRETSRFQLKFFVSTRVENIPEIFCQLLSNNPVLKEVLPFWDFNLILAHTPHWDLFLFGIPSLIPTSTINIFQKENIQQKK